MGMLEIVLDKAKKGAGASDKADAGGDIEKKAGEEADDEAEAGLDQATDEIMDAFQSGDKESLKAALRSFIEQC